MQKVDLHLEENYNYLKNLSISYGIKLFGVCFLDNLQSEFHQEIIDVSSNLHYAISIGYPLSRTVLSTIKYKPTLIYKHHYKVVNYLLDQCSANLCNAIESMGYRALAIPSSQIVNFQEQIGHLSHKKIAYFCGMGYLGKSGLIINPIYGPAVRYATILTDLPLKTDTPIEGSCGNCSYCIESCPANAIGEDGYDKEKCLNKLKEFSKISGIGVYICGVCISVCPIGK